MGRAGLGKALIVRSLIGCPKIQGHLHDKVSCRVWHNHSEQATAEQTACAERPVDLGSVLDHS